MNLWDLCLFCQFVFSVTPAHQMAMSNSIHGHFTPGTQAMHPLHSTLGTTNFLFGRVLEIPLFLLASQIVLLSCFRNHRRNKICSRLQICHSSLQHEKGEVRNNKHIGFFSQGKYVLLDILVTSSLNYFHFSSEVFSYVSCTPTLKTLYAPWDTSKLLI